MGRLYYSPCPLPDTRFICIVSCRDNLLCYLTLESIVVTIYTVRFNIKIFFLLPTQCILYGFLNKQRLVVCTALPDWFYDRGVVYVLRRTSWVCNYSIIQVNLLCKELACHLDFLCLNYRQVGLAFINFLCINCTLHNLCACVRASDCTRCDFD